MTRPSSRRRLALASVAALACSASLLSGCEAVEDPATAQSGGAESASEAPAEEASLRLEVGPKARQVPVDRIVRVRAEDATLDDVDVRHPDGVLPGRVQQDGAVWVASERLEPGVTYTVTARGTSTGNDTVNLERRFTTESLALSEQTYASVAPLDGETVGVGMPVVVDFDIPVSDRALFERHMTVRSTPQQAGSWHWLDDTEVHWRPKEYWKPGTDVAVDLDVNGLDAGNGIYGQDDRHVEFSVGEAHIYKVDARTHQMQVYSNGSLLRTIPITTGKDGFVTRSGVKVIMAKHRSKRMNSETVGIPVGSSEGYDLDNVEYAMRLTHSGEFIHAAPWSVASQGNANVSHGCTGLSTDQAGWLYSMTRRGDVVEYVGTNRPMEPENGYGDWNVPFGEYRQGSALS